MLQIGESPSTLANPLDHLLACHRRIEQRLATLERAGAELATHPKEALAAIASATRFMDTNGARHTEDEEESVFPRLLPYLSPEDAAFVESLEAEHRQADVVYAALKVAVAALPASAGDYVGLAAQLHEVYRLHIEAEETVLLKLARRWLPEAELALIAGEMRVRREIVSN